MNRLFLSSVITLTVFILASCAGNETTTAQSPSPANQTPAESATAMSESKASPTDAMATATIRRGRFTSGEHATEGNVRVVEEGGKRLIEFESNFKTEQGPDLFVILHRSSDVIGTTAAPNHSINAADYVAIAPLQATNGMQRYEIPAEVELENYQSIAIWCRQFNATFGAAPLSAS